MNFTLDTTLGTLLDNPAAKTVLDKYVPGLSTNPMISMVKGMSLNNLLANPMASQFGLTKEKVQQILNEVNAKVGNM